MPETSQSSKPVAFLLGLAVVLLYGGGAAGQVRPSTRGTNDSSSTRVNYQEQPREGPALNITFSIFTFPGSAGTLTAGATKSGHVVGGYGPNVDVDSPSNHAFLLKGQKFTTLDYPGAVYTQANGINDSGVIVGTWGSSYSSSDAHAFKLVGKTYTSFDFPNAPQGTVATGINKSGDIVGSWSDNTTTHGYLLSKGTFTQVDFPGAFYTFTWGINNAGQIAGWYGAYFGDSHGFVYSNGTFTTVDYPGYSQNYVADINDSGVVVGGYGEIVTINGIDYQWEHGYLYQNGQFTTMDAPFGPPAATLIWHFNDSGIVTGYYADNTSTLYGFEAQVGP